MPEPYTPTTALVRDRYFLATMPDNYDRETYGTGRVAKEEFDRWLADRDAKIKAEAAREALLAAADDWSEWEVFIAGDGERAIRKHGKTTDEWLRARANQTETGDKS